ncbi:MAG: type VI secretion system tip protein TssI/VgrG [Desulfobacula sp.]|jgi:type VI secretion system VgrG family protein
MSLLTKMKYSFISRGMDKETFTVVSFKGVEAISRPYEFEIILVSDKTGIDPLKVLQNPAVFTIHRDEEENVDFNGILMQFEETREFDGFLFFKAVLSPKFRWLSLTHHNQVFLDAAVPDILESDLKDGGLVTGIDFEFRLQKNYPSLEYVCQYDESHFDFVSRWAQREGIYYFFEQTPNGEKIIFTDTKISHVDLLLGKDIVYVPQSGLDAAHTKEVVKSFVCKHNMLPQRVYLKDYNYLKPSQVVEGFADVDENGRGENYIYGVNFDTVEEGNRLAKIRAEALLCRKTTFHGESSVPYIVPGFTFDLNDHYKAGYNTKYLVSEIFHEGHQAGYLVSGLSAAVEKRDEQMFYANSFSATYADAQFRAEHITHRPKISGILHAKIDASASGEHAELDEHGRYKVILPFDRSGRFGGKASAWFRMMQPSAGRNQGMHFPLHKGTEVLLTFIDGNPDRPVIAGAIPNPETGSPVTSENQTQSVIATGKSEVDQSVGAAQAFGIDGSGQWKNQQTDNFIEFEDAMASRRIKLHSKGNLWFEAQNRYGEYRTKSAGSSYSTGSEPKINQLLGNFSSADPKYKPKGMLNRHNKDSQGNLISQTNFYNDVFKNAHVHVSSMDKVNTQEGNIYDFGGYWNYNLGNSYVETHLLQTPCGAAPVKPTDYDSNPTEKAKYDNAEKKYDHIKNRAILNNSNLDYDLLDKGGPDWTEIDWTKLSDKIPDNTSKNAIGDAEDFSIGSFDDQWKNSNGIWVDKKFGDAYAYTEGDSIEVKNGSSFSVTHGGKHVDVSFFGSGEIRSWTWDEDGATETREWNSGGALVKRVESWVSDGVTNEENYNLYPFTNKNPHKISETREDDTTGIKSETTYCRDTGNMIAYTSKHQGANSTHTYAYNWANTASASLNFAAGAAFSLNMSEQGAITIDISAVQSINFAMSSDIKLNFKSGFNASFNYPILNIPLTSFDVDMSSLKMELDMTGFTIKLAGVELAKKDSGIKVEDTEKLKLRRRGIRLDESQMAVLQEKLRLHI